MNWALCYVFLEGFSVTTLAVGLNRDAIKTVTLRNGQTIDWVRIESQGEIASPPPSLSFGQSLNVTIQDALEGDRAGPKGTVPILRSTSISRSEKRLPKLSTKSSRIHRRQYEAQHWYVSTSEAIDNHGSSAFLSMFEAYVARTSDFSLLQTAIIRDSGKASVPTQTLEAGWISYPDQVRGPHLFTFYTTNGYGPSGDYIGGWNTEQKGWIQVDNSIYPGVELSPCSVEGGAQHELRIRYNLYNGNWWLAINGKWIGYYPAYLFSQGGGDPHDTLESKANQINWYGEVYQSESDLSTTDMGSGHFAKDGYGKAAYFHSLIYTDISGRDQTYDGSQGVIISDSNRYTIDAHWNTAEAWGSYFYLGGPGAGGTIGG